MNMSQKKVVNQMIICNIHCDFDFKVSMGKYWKFPKLNFSFLDFKDLQLKKKFIIWVTVIIQLD